MSGSGRRRVAVGLADQVTYSLTNFIVTLQVARTATSVEFGVYALLMAALLISSAVNRGLTGEPVIVALSDAEPREWRRVVEAKLWVSLIFGEIVGLVLLEVTQQLLPREFAHLGLVFAVAPVVVFAQDFLRYAALAAARPADALASDLTVVLVQVVASVVLGVVVVPAPAAGVGIWVAATAVGASVGLIRLRVGLRVPERGDLRADRGLAGRFAVDNLITQLSQQGVGYAVGATAGLAAAGGFRAAQTAYMPLAVLILGIQAAVVPELVRARVRSPRAMQKLTVHIAVVVAAACALCVVVAAILPRSVGHAVLGDSWSQAAPLVVLVGVASVAGGVLNIAVAGLRAMADARRTLRVRWAATAVTVVSVVPGAMADGARGAAVGLAVCSWVQSSLWWWQLRRSWQEAAPRPVVTEIRSRVRPGIPAGDGTA